VEPIPQARRTVPVNLLGMNREQAELERVRLAAEHPETTWLVAEREPGEWAVVKVALAPNEAPTGSATEARPKPDYAEDPRPATNQLVPPYAAG
jgi:hypothetical protein